MLLSPYFFDLGSTALDAMDCVIMLFVLSLMIVQSAGLLLNSLKELYSLIKRNFGRDLRPNPVKLSKSTKRIDLNNLNDFFEDKTPTNMGENIQFAHTVTPSQDLR
ncbi:unnamed protein product [Blepharisma stoltei]|uniref:Uncharacterized protein n=1 Tax=Blepharisma stoltei TaxID=1481888 RepID=A0AAU9KP98_9CILI|nr:unnamed protein product [Blepharisma stoltei]